MREKSTFDSEPSVMIGQRHTAFCRVTARTLSTNRPVEAITRRGL